MKYRNRKSSIPHGRNYNYHIHCWIFCFWLTLWTDKLHQHCSIKLVWCNFWNKFTDTWQKLCGLELSQWQEYWRGWKSENNFIMAFVIFVEFSFTFVIYNHVYIFSVVNRISKMMKVLKIWFSMVCNSKYRNRITRKN